MMTRRCLRPQAGVYNYAQDCGRRGRGRPPGLGPAPQGPSALHRHGQSWNPSEKTTPLTLLPKWEMGIRPVTRKYQTHAHTCAVNKVLSSRLSLSRVPGLYSCCPPRDWCLASLAVTNTDWSQTLDDFGPNLFKDASLLVSAPNSHAAGKYLCVAAEHGELGR